MSANHAIEILPERSLSARRRDYVCAALLILPLVLLAFQGTLIFGVAERLNYQGRYTEITAKEAELGQVKAETAAVVDQITKINFNLPGAEGQVRPLQARQGELKQRKDSLEREIKNRRKPLEDETDSWNFSFVSHWPLSLLLGPVLLTILWLMVPADERRRLYQAALDSGARTRGLWLALLALAVFWVGVWQQMLLGKDLLAHQGTEGYAAPLWQQWAFVLDYLSLAGWSAAGIYAFAGWPGVRRVWLPLAAILALLILNYGRMSGTWSYLWDKKEQWSYGYLIGPIAVGLLYFKLAERQPAAALQPAPGGQAAQAGAGAFGGEGYDAGKLLALWGVAGVVGTLAVWLLATEFNRGAAVRAFIWLPLLACGAMLLLGVWQLLERGRRGDVAMRLAGLAVLVAALLFDVRGVELRIAYFSWVSLIGVLLGGALALFGYGVFRTAWVALTFIYLAIPWPERAYVDLAGIPQRWAAEMTVRIMNLFGYSVFREGTVIIVGPTMEDKLEVAQECSGLKMLFAFVALSVVYAYISKRPVWRRIVIVASSVPIAVAANFARVTFMALAYRLGFRGVTVGLEHEMAGFVIMLPLAFALLYLEMRLLDFGQWLIASLCEEERPAERAALTAQPRRRRNGLTAEDAEERRVTATAERQETAEQQRTQRVRTEKHMQKQTPLLSALGGLGG